MKAFSIVLAALALMILLVNVPAALSQDHAVTRPIGIE
jgi:hypothetical protein